jgi:hypothetical protein
MNEIDNGDGNSPALIAFEWQHEYSKEIEISSELAHWGKSSCSMKNLETLKSRDTWSLNYYNKTRRHFFFIHACHLLFWQLPASTVRDNSHLLFFQSNLLFVQYGFDVLGEGEGVP